MRKSLKNISVFTAGVILLFTACSKSNSDDSSSSVPYVAVSLSINVNTTLYDALATVGGVVNLANVGYRGILLYRLNTSTIMAYDRTCTYDISDANGIVYAQTNGTAECLDCYSAYSLTNGNVVTGPSTIGLKVYATTFNPSSGALTITN